MRKRNHLRRVDAAAELAAPAEFPEPEIDIDDKPRRAAQASRLLGERTIERLHQVESNDRAFGDLLRTLPAYELHMAHLFAMPPRDGLLGERISYELGRRAGIAEVLGEFDGDDAS